MLGEKVYVGSIDVKRSRLPCPADLKMKILIKVKLFMLKVLECVFNFFLQHRMFCQNLKISLIGNNDITIFQLPSVKIFLLWL